jgi:PII-like signaling protein
VKGYQIQFLTEQNRRIEHQPASQWLLNLARELGIAGATVYSGVESVGADGRRHSARFFELTDQPVEVMMAVTNGQAEQLFERLRATATRLVYVKSPAEFGELGTEAKPG